MQLIIMGDFHEYDLPPLLYLPYALRHVDTLAPVPINIGHQREISLKTLHSEQTVHKGIQQTLVKIVVYATSVNTLREESTHGTPGDLVGGKVSTTLRTDRQTDIYIQ